jgi:LuxR family maltose regulon positive regulatory protein
VVVLDDLHVLHDGGIVAAVGYLSRNLPSHVHLIVASRQPPRFLLHRLRLSGELVEIGDADLRFSVDEALELFGLVGGGSVGADQVRVVVERCEGWAAGLQLAALALPAGGDLGGWASGVAGNSELVDEYFWSELLGPQPWGARQFLLRTSVVERLTAGVCAEVTGRADARQVLESLARENLFLVRWDGPGGGYRYHRLFGEFLRHRLALEGPEGAVDAHRRAAAWYKRNGDVGAAVAHLVAAGAGEEAFALSAGALVDQVRAGFGRGEACLPAGLPSGFFEGDPFRLWVLAAVLLCAGRVVEAAGWLHRLDQVAPGHPAAGWWQGRVEWLWAVHDGLVGDGAGVLGHCRSAAGLLASAVTDNGEGADVGWWDAMDGAMASQVAVFAARAHLWLGAPGQAREVLAAGCDCHDAACLGALAATACVEGRLREAFGLARRSLAEAERQHRADTAVTVDARLALGVVLWERHDLGGAADQLEMARGRRQSWMSRLEWAVELRLIGLLISQRQTGEALDALRRLRQVERREPLPDGVAADLDDMEIGCRVASGDLDGAVLILKSMPKAGRRPSILARVDLCAGRPDRAVARLTAAPACRLAVAAEVERLTLLARAELQLGNRRRAEDALRRALDCGRPEGFIRVFVEHTPELLGLLQDLGGRFPDVYLADVLTHARHAGSPTAPPPPHSTLEPLTERERETLRHLTGHLTQPEIASGMYLSVNTVKSHVKCLYRKLGAGSRSEAIAAARAHGLL